MNLIKQPFEMITKIHNMKVIVKKILIDSPKARDNDDLLRLKVWATQNPSLRNANYLFMDFADDLLKESYADAESIRRTRQKLQEKHPELRGDKYIARLKAEIEMRAEMPKLQL